MLGDLRGARPLFEECLAIRRELGDAAGIARSLDDLGNLAQQEGDCRTARTLLEESLVTAKALGDRAMVCAITSDIGDLAVEEGDYARADTLLEESLGMAREMGWKGRVAEILLSMGNLATAQGNYLAAAASYEECAALETELGDVVISLWFSGRAANMRGEHTTARALFTEALALYVERHRTKGVAETLAQLGAVYVDMGQTQRGVVLLGSAEELVSGIGVQMCPACRMPYERARATAQTQLAEVEFQKAWQEGQAMTMDQAIDYALQSPRPPTPEPS